MHGYRLIFLTIDDDSLITWFCTRSTSKYRMLGSDKLKPRTPTANIILLELSKVMSVGVGWKELYLVASQAISFLFMVVIALSAKRIENMQTTRREVIPPESVL